MAVHNYYRPEVRARELQLLAAGFGTRAAEKQLRTEFPDHRLPSAKSIGDHRRQYIAQGMMAKPPKRIPRDRRPKMWPAIVNQESLRRRGDEVMSSLAAPPPPAKVADPPSIEGALREALTLSKIAPELRDLFNDLLDLRDMVDDAMGKVEVTMIRMGWQRDE